MLIVVLLLKMHFIDDKYLADVRTCRNVLGLTQSLWRNIAAKINTALVLLPIACDVFNQYCLAFFQYVEAHA